MRKQQILLVYKVTNILEPAEKRENQYVDSGFHCLHCQEQCWCIHLKRMWTSTKRRIQNEHKGNVDMTFEEVLENCAKMDFDDYIKSIRSSLKAPKVFLKRKTKDMGINLFNEGIFCAWKANLDIQIFLEPYGCASYIVGYISKSQRGMNAQLELQQKRLEKEI